MLKHQHAPKESMLNNNNMIDYQSVEKVIKETLGDVSCESKGFTAPGKFQILINVGKKPNPAYNPAPDPNSSIGKYEGYKEPEKYEDDIRVLNLNGVEDKTEIIKKLKPIIDSLPGNKHLPKQEMSTIKPVNDLTDNIPQAPSMLEKKVTEMMGDVANTLSNINDRLSKLENKGTVEVKDNAKKIKK